VRSRKKGNCKGRVRLVNHYPVDFSMNSSV
jgi:hypothetical protein